MAWVVAKEMERAEATRGEDSEEVEGPGVVEVAEGKGIGKEPQELGQIVTVNEFSSYQCMSIPQGCTSNPPITR